MLKFFCKKEISACRSISWCYRLFSYKVGNLSATYSWYRSQPTLVFWQCTWYTKFMFKRQQQKWYVPSTIELIKLSFLMTINVMCDLVINYVFKSQFKASWKSSRLILFLLNLLPKKYKSCSITRLINFPTKEIKYWMKSKISPTNPSKKYRNSMKKI